MAKFKQNNVELRDNQKVIFDSAKNKYMIYDGTNVSINTTLGGVDPIEDDHLTTKIYVDSRSLDDIPDVDVPSPDDGDIIVYDSTSQNWINEAPPVFGTEYQYTSSDAESSTSADTPQQKVRLTTPSLPNGSYHIEWGYEFNIDDNKNSDFNAQVQINDTTTIAEQGNDTAWKTDVVWIAQSGFYDAVLSGVLDIDIDFWDSGAAGVSIRRARLVIWRVD